MRTAELSKNLISHSSFDLTHLFSFATALLIDKIQATDCCDNPTHVLELSSFLMAPQKLSHELSTFKDSYYTQAIAPAFSDLPHNTHHSLVCDESHLPFSATFDAIISSLHLHLTEDPKATLQQMLAVLKPGGTLFLTCLGHHSLFEWRSLFLNEGIACGLIDFINPGLLETWLPRDGTRQLQEHWIRLPIPAIKCFLHQLKALKLNTPSQGYTPTSFKTFKKLCGEFHEGPHQNLSFQLLCLVYHKPTIIRDE